MNTTNNQEIPKNYNAQDWEDKLYQQWEKSGFFNPDICIEKGITDETKPAFSIVLPPPNVTGRLHCGHAAMLAIEDVIVRFKRMQGFRTLWLPGTDHAAIATQSKVEKIIYKEEGKTRHNLGREELLQRIEQFAQKSHDTIIHQTKKLGASLDWSREAYTLDEKRELAVRTAFKKMYGGGIIYQGTRIVNWDPQLQTTVSDDEIEWKEERIPFYYLQYGPFTISTARPETKFGDKYVVMHPNDERYQMYKHGQKINLEWINGPVTATVIKDESANPEFGSGAMTITPWHDATDFEIAERHNLDKEQIIDEQGGLLPIAGEFAGLPALEARKKIVEKLQEKGLLVKIEENYIHNIAVNSRGGGIIEPQIKKQWFVSVNKEFEKDGKTTTLKELMLDAVQSKKIEILPKRFGKTYFHWINNLRDWCISRQIWFGHRIPVWYCRAFDKEQCQIGCETPIISIETPLACPVCGSKDLEQDPDTLDTWFSSGLWTFSTLGWPNTDAEDFKNYHPTSLLETGYDILFFWVARMILMTGYLLNDIPFKTVYLHGLVRDEKGRKMSKSLDNIIDPLDMIESYGADALRMSLIIGSTPGNDIRLYDEKIKTFRNFTNKLWNIGRYASNAGYMKKLELKTNADHWILSRLQEIIKEVTRLLENYQLSLAGEKLRDFTWNEFADWYVEIHKIEKNDDVLNYVFETLLRLWHPFMPFVTESIHQTLHSDDKTFLMTERWPQPEADIFTKIKSDDANRFQSVVSIIQEIRALRSFYKIDPAKYVNVTIKEGANERALSQNNGDIFKRLARVSDIHVIRLAEAAPKKSVHVSCGLLDVYIELESVIDFDTERKRLEKEKTEKEKYITTLETKLGNKNFIERAKAEIVQAEKTRLEEAKKQLVDLEYHLDLLD